MQSRSLIYSTRDQNDATSPNFHVDRFVGARTNNDRLIGSMRLVNAAGQDELDELIFEVSTDTLARATLSYQVTATDPDGDAPLTFELLSGPPGAAIDRVTGLLTWTATNANAGSPLFTVQVGDGHGGTAQQTFNLTVQVTPATGADGGGSDGGADGTADGGADSSDGTGG